MSINKPAVKPILLGKKIILKPDKVPTIGSDSLVTSGALAEALQNKNVALNDSSDSIIPTGDIIIGRLGEDSAFYIINPNFLGTKWMKLETLETGKLYYDKFTHTYYTFQGYIIENKERVGYKFEPLVLPSIVKVTWQELKDLRDNSKLIPGLKYRITDYQCTTTQENTRSAGHQFDIVLLALSENKLAEEGWAMHHANDTYFANSNLSAWKVWYCLDNDKSKFAWADDSISQPSVTVVYKQVGSSTNYDNVIYYRDESLDKVGNEGTTLNIQFYAWTTNDERVTGNKTEYSETLNVTTDTTFHHNTHSNQFSPLVFFQIVSVNLEQIPNGHGVIYRLIDEFNNDIKYDFKNIQFKRTITDGAYDANGTETWCYTLNVWYNDMCQDASIVGNILPNDEGYINGVYDNRFGYATAYDAHIEGTDTFAYVLGDNVVLSIDEGEYYGIYSNMIGDSFFSNTIGTEFYHNTIGNRFYKNMISSMFYDNTIENLFNSNTVGNNFAGNMIGYNFQSNTIGNRFNNNMIGNNFVNKTISDNTYYKNYGSNGIELATK